MQKRSTFCFMWTQKAPDLSSLPLYCGDNPFVNNAYNACEQQKYMWCICFAKMQSYIIQPCKINNKTICCTVVYVLCKGAMTLK